MTDLAAHRPLPHGDAPAPLRAPVEPVARPADSDAPAREVLLALRDGDTALELGDAAAAVACYARAVAAARVAGDASLEARACGRLGDARRAAGDIDGAIAALNGALKAARLHGTDRAIAAAHRELSLACEAAERFEPALVHFKAWHALEVERLRAERRQARDALRTATVGGSGHAPSAFAPSAFAPSAFSGLDAGPTGAAAVAARAVDVGSLDAAPPGPASVAPAPAPASEADPRGAVPLLEPIRLAPMGPDDADAADVMDAPDAAGAAPVDPPPVVTVVTVDPLTLLGDARAAADALARAIADPRLDVALVAIDVDHLASVNETFSAAAGDDVLRRVGLVLLEQNRPGDAAYRVQGDRFHVVLHGASARTAAAVAERLRQAIALHPWHEVQRGLAVTASAGVAVARPGADDAELLEQRARHALRAAKDGGRDRTAIDEP